MQQIGDRIHSLRKGLGISQGEFGSKIGIKKSSVSSMEKNKSNPSTQTIKLICVEFNVNYDWLVNGVGDIFIKNNNSIHERIKYLRKDILHLTQIDFGKRIGIAGTTVTSWEKRNMNPSETALKTICYEFNVNYDWLVDGDGDIFIENNDSIELLKKDYDLEDNEVKAIKAFLNLNKVERKVLVYYLEKAFGKDGQ